MLVFEIAISFKWDLRSSNVSKNKKFEYSKNNLSMLFPKTYDIKFKCPNSRCNAACNGNILNKAGVDL